MWRAVVSQPLDRSQTSPQLGPLDTAAGEFWVTNPFQMPRLGHNLSAFETNRLFMNVDGARFMDASFASQANIDSDSRSIVVGDMNADGATDLLVGSVGGGPLRLFLNRFPRTHHRVMLELQGSVSNRAAIGSRVVLRTGTTTITRSLFPANGFMGQSPAELLIGVGTATTIDELVIRWPTGEMQSFENLPVDQRLKITEGEDAYHSLSF
jgi:hypothetical protein